MALRVRIRDDVFQGLIGADCAGDVFIDVLQGLDEVFGAGKVLPEVLFRTAQSHLLGSALTKPVIDRFAWRVAGNAGRIRAGTVLYPWTAQHEPEWVPWRITAGFKAVDGKGRSGFDYTFQALAGTPTALEIGRFWRRELIHVVARKIGFTNRRGTLPMDHPAMLVGCVLYGLVEPALSAAMRPGFHRVACASSMITANRKLLKMRHRRGWNCPRDYRHPCHRCSIGYARPADTRCPAATHPCLYAVGPCRACGRPRAIFDPAVDPDRCIACVERARCRKEE
jgi:hypothetical protein